MFCLPPKLFISEADWKLLVPWCCTSCHYCYIYTQRTGDSGSTNNYRYLDGLLELITALLAITAAGGTFLKTHKQSSPKLILRKETWWILAKVIIDWTHEVHFYRLRFFKKETGCGESYWESVRVVGYTCTCSWVYSIHGAPVKG